MTGIIVEEYVGFFFVNIEACRSNLALLDAFQQCFGIDQGTSGCVDEYNAFLHFRDGITVDHVPVLFGERAVERYDVTSFPELVERYIFDAGTCCGELVVSDDVHSESAADINEDPADLTCSDNAHGLAVKVKTCQTVEAEIEVFGADVSFVDPSYRCQKECHGVLCDSVRGVGGNADDVDFSVSIFDIDIVVAGAS